MATYIGEPESKSDSKQWRRDNAKISRIVKSLFAFFSPGMLIFNIERCEK